MDPYLVYLISKALFIWTVVATIFLLLMIFILMKDNDERGDDKDTRLEVRKLYPQTVREWFEMQELEFEDRLLTKSHRVS